MAVPQIFGFRVVAYIRDRVSVEDRGHSTACWVWQRCVKEDGYAVGKPPGHDRITRIARAALEASVGPIPRGLEVDHLCQVRSCCNPSHLEAVTHAENMVRQAASRKSCRNGHPFAGDNLYIFPSGVRTCRTCKANREKNRPPRKAIAA